MSSSAPRWLLVVAALLAVWMLTLFVQLLNDSVHRGESLRAQQNAPAQAVAARAHAQAVRVKTVADGLLATR